MSRPGWLRLDARVAAAAAALAACAALLALRQGCDDARDPVTVLAAVPGEAGARAGSWWFPRGGPFVLGFEVGGGASASLAIDGQVVAEGQGRVLKRVVFAAGARAVTLRVSPPEAMARVRLLWHPPGRRGAPEYVPPSSLSAEPPERARFGGGAGASRGDAAIATAMLLLLAAAGLLALRPRLGREQLRAALPFVAVLVAALAVRLWGLSAAGQTWDEDEYWSSGRNYVVNALSLDFRDPVWRWNFEHPPVTKYIAGLGALWQDGYGAARGLFALCGAAACLFTALVGARLYGRRAGILAGVACAFTPHLIAHSRVIGHETPSVLLWAVAVWASLRVHDLAEAGRPVRPRARLVAVGVVLGLAVATRFTNLLLAPVVAATLLAMAPAGRRLWTLGWGAALVPVSAVATFAAVWPRMWTQPLRHLDQAWNKLKLPHSLEPYLGQYTLEPAWHYFAVYALAVTPVALLALALAGGGWRAAARRERGWLVVAAWLLLPFGVGWSPVRQDGVRYVLPALPALALAAGAGLDALGELAARRWRHAAVAMGAALALYLAVTCARIAPYYLDYYGEAVGGAGRAQRDKLFEVAWWGEGIGEAVDYVNAHAPEGARLYKLLQPTHVNWFRVDLWRNEVGSPMAAEWIVVNDAGIFAAGRRFVPPGDAVLVHEVRAGGASLARVYRRESAAAPAPASRR